ncbi:MAG: HU family DNA-binding protein [Betaproteobacteria bacterium]|nr:HU family DNA-binding protein [Betaproteobacteria bacterium]
MKKPTTVSTSQLISAVASKHDELPKKVTKELIVEFLAEIESELVSRQSKIRLDKVGIIQVKERAARKGRNPQTGEEIRIPASKKVAFRAAKSLKEAVGIKKKAATAKKAPARKK